MANVKAFANLNVMILRNKLFIIYNLFCPLDLRLEWNYLLKYLNVNYTFQESRYFKLIFKIVLLIWKLDSKYIARLDTKMKTIFIL